MDLPASFVEADGSVVVNFGILTGREATIAEVDRLARSISLAGGNEISIVAQRTARVRRGGRDGPPPGRRPRRTASTPTQLERLCTLWVHDCAADRHVSPL